MEQFRKLGEEVENLWREQNYNESLFPAIAAEELRRADLPAKISAWEVIEWTLRQTELPKQKDVKGNFGDPPITLFTAPRFYIDVYFWFEGTTATHQHGFCGAFQVLHGSSIHSWFDFERQEAINSFTEIGRMSLKVCELLEKGAVQEIRAGREYIHSLFHLDQPSATIVIRTEKSPLFLPQFSYHKPSLAIDPFYEEETVIKKIQSAAALIRANRPDADETICELLDSADFQTTFQILSALYGASQSNKIDELFDLAAPKERFTRFMETTRKRHGERADALVEVFKNREQADELVRRRSYVTNPEHRFLFALLMNVEGRDRIFSLVKQRYPTSDPIDKILDWIFDLAQTRVLGVNTPNALGIADFDDLDLTILEGFLRNKTAEEITADVQKEVPEEKLSGLAERIGRIQQSVIFQPLLSRTTDC